MKKIDWEDSRKKTAAYEYLVKVFKTTKPSVSLAMSFKRNSLEAARMRHVAIHELGGRLLSDENVTVSPVEIDDDIDTPGLDQADFRYSVTDSQNNLIFLVFSFMGI